ncbi:MAG: MlaE family ABC transporter permease [Candidatus Aminicenantia bacterium]
MINIERFPLISKFFWRMGRGVRDLGEISILIYFIFRKIFTKPFEKRMFLAQLIEIGNRSLPVVSLTSLFTGMVLALQTFIGMKRFGGEMYVGSVVGISLTKELIPVLTGLMVAGRVGSAMAAEIGTMKVTEQIDALYTLGADPIKYLVIPRFISAIIMVPVLTAYGDAIGLIGARFVSVQLMGLTPTLFSEFLLLYTEWWDATSGLIKALFFGAIIAIIGCFKGIKTEGGAEGVGKSTTSAVVVSSILILIADFFVAKILPFSMKR